MTNFLSGRNAEEAAAKYLKQQGYKVIEQNWRTRWCEIDIVAQKGETIYFVEVKYRVSDKQGSGLDYITPAKQKQMAFAAEFWVSEHEWTRDYALAAIEVTGNAYSISQFVTDL